MIRAETEAFQAPLQSSRHEELLIAFGRVFLAAETFVASQFDVADLYPGSTVQAALSIYFVYAVLPALVSWRVWFFPARIGLTSHLLDCRFLPPPVPFYSYFIFALVASGIRWRLRGVIWTAIGAMLAYSEAR